MGHRTRRGQLVVLLAGLSLASTACDAQTAQNWGDFARELAGGLLGGLIAIIVALASLAPPV
jgi:hypothetical protein